MRLSNLFLVCFLLGSGLGFGQQVLQPKPSDPYFTRFNPVKAPKPDGLLLKKGDRLAICGAGVSY